MSAVGAGKTRLDAENPYPGLRSFSEADREFFLGREAEIDQLYRRVKTGQLTTCFGRSGLGKTSLLLAGLFPLLREQGYFPVYIRVGYAKGTAAPAEQVLSQTRSAAEKQQVDVPQAEPGETLWEYFHRAEFWGAGFKLLKPVLVFDQFEELFTLTRASDPRRAPFIRELSDLIENRIPTAVAGKLAELEEQPYSFEQQPYRVLLSLREDFLPELENLRKYIPSLAKNRIRLLPMDGEAAFRVVTQIKGRVSDEVATDIVQFVAGDDDAQPLASLSLEPVLLSIFCRELNNARMAAGLPTMTMALLESRSEEILHDFYEHTLEGYDNKAEVSRFIEERLLTSSGRRNPIALEDVLAEDAVIDEECISKLIDDRLIRRDERDGVWLELTHDLLTGVIRDSRDQRRAIERERETAKAEVRLKKVRRRNQVLIFICLLAVIATAIAGWQTWTARNHLNSAMEAKKLLKENLKKYDALQKLLEKQKKREVLEQSVERGEGQLAGGVAGTANSREQLAVERSKERSEVDDALQDLSKAKKAASLAELGVSSSEEAIDQLLEKLSSDERAERQSALRELKSQFSGDKETLWAVLRRLEEDKFSATGRVNALNLMVAIDLSVWDEDLVDEAKRVLGGLLEGERFGSQTLKLLNRTLRISMLAGTNVGDKAYRQKTVQQLLVDYPDDPVVIEEIGVRLGNDEFGTVGIYNAFFYLNKVSPGFWKKHKNMIDGGIKVLDGLPVLGPQTTKEVNKLRKTFKKLR